MSGEKLLRLDANRGHRAFYLGGATLPFAKRTPHVGTSPAGLGKPVRGALTSPWISELTVWGYGDSNVHRPSCGSGAPFPFAHPL